MINLTTYKIDTYLYKVEDEYTFPNETLIIKTILLVNDNVYFFCEKKNDKFRLRASATSEVAVSILPIHAVIFHNRVISTVNN